MRPPATPLRLSGVAVCCYVFVPFALGHFLSSLLRNVSAVLAPTLVGALALTPSQLGLLSSAFFLSLALAQLPVGMALERYGARRVQLVLMLFGAFGMVMFAQGQDFTQLVLARAVMGFGLGGCFMAAVKAISPWIAPTRLPTVHAYLTAAGGLGAAASTMPVRIALAYTGWRGLFVLLGALTVCCALLIVLLAPRARNGATAQATGVRSLLDVVRAPAFRRTTALVLVPHMVFFGVQGLWIERWLTDVGRFPDSSVAWLLSLSMAAVIFGAIGSGMITEWAGRRGVAPLDVAAVGVAAFVLVQALVVLNYAPSFQLLSVLFTLVGTITGIEYAIVAQTMPKELTGRAATCLNLLIFSGAFLVQAGFGQLVGLWEPDRAGHYPVVAYRVAFGVLVLLQLPGLVRYFLRRRPVKCDIALLTQKEDHEISTLRSSR
jgi:MFS family permease